MDVYSAPQLVRVQAAIYRRALRRALVWRFVDRLLIFLAALLVLAAMCYVGPARAPSSSAPIASQDAAPVHTPNPESIGRCKAGLLSSGGSQQCC